MIKDGKLSGKNRFVGIKEDVAALLGKVIVESAFWVPEREAGV